jgi:hypothetical protein
VPMTEAEWHACDSARPMVAFLGDGLSARRQILLACADFRSDYEEVRVGWEQFTGVHQELHLRVHELHRQVVEAAERLVDGRAMVAGLDALHAAIERALAEDPYPNDLLHNTLPDCGGRAANLARFVRGDYRSLLEGPEGADPYYCPFPKYSSGREARFVREVAGNPFRPVAFDPAWRTPDVTALATSAYDERRMPSGELDPHRLAIHADALEEVGASEEVVAHLRSPGVHVRGCWVVDLCLGRS